MRELAVYQHGIITTDDLRGLGLSPSTISFWRRTGRLVRLAPRAYLVPDLLDNWSHLAAACLSIPGAIASHQAAACLWNLDGIEVDRAEVTVARHARSPFALVHRSDDVATFEVVERELIACTDATRTLVDLGAVVDDTSVERALESALRRGLTSVSRLSWRLGQLARPGRAGPPVLRRVLDRRPTGAPPTESELETRFLQVLRAAGVGEPVRQRRVRLPSGLWVRLDFAYPDERVFIETDGRSHAGWQVQVRDKQRQNQVVLLGWKPLRFTWADMVHRPDEVVAEVVGALTARRAS